QCRFNVQEDSSLVNCTVSVLQSYLGFPYYLRIDLLCGSKRAILEALLTGLTPNVVLTFQEPVHPIRLKSQRLQIILTTAPLLDSGVCACVSLGWYAPMPILNGSVVYRVQVVSNGQGQLVPERRSVTTVCLFKCARETEISFALEDMMVLGSPSRPLWAVVQSSPVLILPGIPGFKAVLMTATEFQHTSPIEVGIESCWAGSLNCPQVEFSSMILEAISTESSLFIRQNQLLHRFVGNFSLLPLRAPPSGTSAPSDNAGSHSPLCVSMFVCVHVCVFQLWWGQEGVDQVMRVRPSLGWQAFSSLQALKGDSSYSMTHSLLTVFYDWDKQFIFLSPVLSPLPPRSFSAFSFPLTCPFFWEHMADLPHPEPYNRIQQYLTRPPLVPTSLGLQTTASLATYQGLLYHLLQLHSDYIMDIGDPVHNPTWRWWKDKDYYFYMASNGVSSTGFNVEIGGYSRAYMSSEITFPDMVYLDRVSSFSFSIYIACGSAKHLSVEEKPRGGSREWAHGLHRVPIYIGCPPGKRLAFDITTTLEQCANNNKRYFNCPKPNPIMPCFYYEDCETMTLNLTCFEIVNVCEDISFDPKSKLHTYILYISAAGSTAVKMSDCILTGQCLLFFFRGIDLSTYCDYALRFILHVHGFPLDPSRGLFYMLVCSLFKGKRWSISYILFTIHWVIEGTWSEDVTAIYTMHGHRAKS
uniref:Uncharacterized protein n=1 Tax=Salmo trutta TaxID=8032 RepID=A0A673WBK1_SALTR